MRPGGKDTSVCSQEPRSLQRGPCWRVLAVRSVLRVLHSLQRLRCIRCRQRVPVEGGFHAFAPNWKGSTNVDKVLPVNGINPIIQLVERHRRKTRHHQHYTRGRPALSTCQWPTRSPCNSGAPDQVLSLSLVLNRKVCGLAEQMARQARQLGRNVCPYPLLPWTRLKVTPMPTGRSPEMKVALGYGL